MVVLLKNQNRNNVHTCATKITLAYYLIVWVIFYKFMAILQWEHA